MFTRREWIAGSSLFAWGAFTGDLFAKRDQPMNFGWLPDINYAGPMMSQHGQAIKGSGKDKVVRLWKIVEEVEAIPFDNYVQVEGTCVGQASGLGASTLDAVQVVVHGQGQWKGHYAAEPIYAGSKVEIGLGKDYIPPQSQWAWKAFDGTRCQFAVEWMMDYGLTPRAKYGKYDLSKTDCKLAIQWSRSKNGVPAVVEDECKKNPLIMAVKIDGGWEQAIDCVAHGYPVLIGSSYGYNTIRNSDGLLDIEGIWQHATLLWGFDTKSYTHVGCIANSWPRDWISGPTYKYPAPASAFWTGARNVDKMLRQGNSYALSNLHGYPLRITDYSF